MPAVGQPPDLVLPFEVVQTNSAAFRRVDEVRELDDRKEFPDEESRDGDAWRTRREGGGGTGNMVGFGPGNVGFKEIGEADTMEESGNEFANVRKERK
ncbi:hypothetical protein V6N12_013272 [Hibiscus sabdariffa]|uniref:Uncharacterized protein n=1 Tax=Hibiscus sabdariffa TaxID=183260 RepID=A0ABR2D7Q7_9ROSI